MKLLCYVKDCETELYEPFLMARSTLRDENLLPVDIVSPGSLVASFSLFGPEWPEARDSF